MIVDYKNLHDWLPGGLGICRVRQVSVNKSLQSDVLSASRRCLNRDMFPAAFGFVPGLGERGGGLAEGR